MLYRPSTDASRRSYLDLSEPRTAGALLDALAGRYDNLEYRGSDRNAWHVVSLHSISGSSPPRLSWTNCASVVWHLSLARVGTGYNATHLAVEPDCPYYDVGHHTAEIVWNAAGTAVMAIHGPWSESYTRLSSTNDVARALVGDYVAVNGGSEILGRVGWTSRTSELHWIGENNNGWCSASPTALSSGFADNRLTMSSGGRSDCGSSWNGGVINRDEDYSTVRSIAAPPIGVAVRRVHTAAKILDALVGTWHQTHEDPGRENSWHRAVVTPAGDDAVRWTNEGGVSWLLRVRVHPDGGEGVDDTHYGNSNTSYMHIFGEEFGEMFWDPSHTWLIAITDQFNQPYYKE